MEKKLEKILKNVLEDACYVASKRMTPSLYLITLRIKALSSILALIEK